MVVICKTSDKINDRVKQKKGWGQQGKLVARVLWSAAALLLAASLFLKAGESRNLTRWLGFGLLGATGLFFLFKSSFGNKPTREEMEERTFGNKAGKEN